jgi:hypothetical protein
MVTRVRRWLAVGIAASFALVVPTGVAGSNEPGGLGFKIDQNAGQPGAEITGQVDPADVAEHCLPFGDANPGPAPPYTTVSWRQKFMKNFGRWTGPGTTPADTWVYKYRFGPWVGQPVAPGAMGDNAAVMAFVFLFTSSGFPEFVRVNVGEAGTAAWEASHVMAMATLGFDIVEVLAPGFNPATGAAGPMVTPDVTPGVYAVAAVCNSIMEPTPENEEAGLAAMAAAHDALTEIIIEANGGTEVGLPASLPGYPLGMGIYLEQALPIMLTELFTQDGLGVGGLYCVLDAVGTCNGLPVDPPPAPPLGLSIQPFEGFPGQAVIGQVDVGDIAANCNPGLDDTEFGPYPTVWADLFARNYEAWTTAYEGAKAPPGPEGDPVGSAWEAISVLFPLGITEPALTGNTDGALTLFEASFAFVMATLEQDFLVVNTPGFDPFTGEAGPLITPFDATPGVYAIAAACNNVGGTPHSDGLDALEGAVDELAALIVEFATGPNGGVAALDEDGPCFADGDPFALLPECILPAPLGTDETNFISDILPELLPDVLPELFEQWGLGFELYCVLTPEGVCPGDAAIPVSTTPRFTG